jgi:hypothetical protein
MDEKYIEKIYAKFGEEVLGSFDKFSELISTDEKYQRKIYDNLGGEEVFGGYPEYSTLISRRSEGEVAESLNDMWNSPKEGSDMMNIDAAPVKKKEEPTDLLLESGLSGQSALTTEALETTPADKEAERQEFSERLRRSEVPEFRDDNWQPGWYDAFNETREDAVKSANVFNDVSNSWLKGEDGKILDAFGEETEASRLDREELRAVKAQVQADVIARRQIAERAKEERDNLRMATANEARQALLARESRPVARKNEDGTESSHLMTSYEEDGVFKVVPTLFPKDGFVLSPNASKWDELPIDEAIARATERGEVYTFSTEEAANAFAEGSWKYASTVDVEGERFFANRGLDYADYMAAEDVYNTLLDEQESLAAFGKEVLDGRLLGDDEIKLDDLTEDEREELDVYFDENGRVNYFAIQERFARLTEESEALRDVIGVGTDGYTAREDFDVVLEEQNVKRRTVAADIHAEAKFRETALLDKSIAYFDMAPSELLGFEPRNNVEVEQFNEIVEDYLQLEAIKGAASLEYQLAMSYLNTKQNKALQAEYTDGIEAINNEINNGLQRGKGAEILVKMSTGIIDVDNEEELMDAVTRMADIESNKRPSDGRTLSRYNRARNADEYRAVIAENPIEWMTQLAASSLSQILPYGWKVVAGAAATGFGVGAVRGGVRTRNPRAALASAVAGTGEGIYLGMSANNFIMEYTSAVLEAVHNKGYDATIPTEYAAALRDPEVWAEANDRGVKRGLAISAVDYMGLKLAGRVFAPALAMRSMGVKGALRVGGMFVAERFTFDPAVEGFGEVLAQMAVGDDLRWKDIWAEMGGAGGSNVTVATVKAVRASVSNNVEGIAQTFLNLDQLARDKSTDLQITNWTNRQVKLEAITPEQGQSILEGVGLRREANDLLAVNDYSKLTSDEVEGLRQSERPLKVDGNKDARARLMELLEKRERLTSTTNRKSLYADKIAQINNEIRIISETGMVVENPVELDMIIGVGRREVPSYRIGKKYVGRGKFIEEIEKASGKKLARIVKDARVTNDPEVAAILNAKIKDVLNDPNRKVKKSEDLIAAPGETTVAAEAVAQDVAVEEDADVDAEAAALEAELLQTEQTQDDTPYTIIAAPVDERQKELDDAISKADAEVAALRESDGSISKKNEAAFKEAVKRRSGLQRSGEQNNGGFSLKQKAKVGKGAKFLSKKQAALADRVIQAIIDSGLKNGLSAEEISNRIISRHAFELPEVQAIKQYVAGLVNNTTEQGNSKQSFSAWRQAKMDSDLTTETKTQDDAIQEPSTETVPAQEPSADSAEVGEGVPATEQATEQAQAEDQATEAAVEKEFKFVALVEDVVNDNSFTHRTPSIEAIETWANSGQVVGRGETINTFNDQVPATLSERVGGEQNRQSPNFQRGKIYGKGTADGKGGFVIISKTDAITDEDVVPNRGFTNQPSFDKSRGVGVVKPNKRGIENYDVYSVNEDGSLTKRDWSEFKSQPKKKAVEEEVDEQDVLYDKAIEDAPDNVVDLYDKWLSVLFSPEMDAIEEQPSVDRTRAESAKVGAMTRRMGKAMKAAKDAGISSRDANILMRAVQRKFTKSQDTDVIEAAPVSEETFVGEFQSNEVADALIDEAVSKATPKKKAAAKKKAPATKPTPQPTPATKQVVETKEEVAVDETSVQELDSELDKSREDFKAKKLALENDIEALQNKRKALPKKKITPTKKALQAAEISKDIQSKNKAIKALERSYNAESTSLSVRKAAAKQAVAKKQAAPTKKAAPVAKAAPKRKAAPKATKGKSMSELARVDITAMPEQELIANLKILQEITKSAVKAKDKKQETIGRTGIRVYKAEIARRATEETKPAAKKKAAPIAKAAPVEKAAPAKKSDTKNIDAQIKQAKQKLKKNPKSEEIIAELRSLNKQLRTIENDAKKPLIENYRNEAMWGKAIGEWSSNFVRQERLIAESEAKTPTQFQLQVDTKVNQEEIDSMKRLMDEANLESEASVVEPPVMETIPIIVEENGQLVAKVARWPLSFLEGKLVNLAMADQLKVADGSMGGPFFSLQEGIFGKVAWASIDKSAAMSIIRGAAVGDYTVVFNMLPSAVDSNVVSLEYAMGLINSLEDGPQVFADMMQRIQERKFNRKGEPGRTEKVHEMAQTVKNSDEFVKAFEKLGVDLRADITKAIFPTEKTNPKNEYLKRLRSEGITLENIRAANAEQAVADLPMGAMTVVLEITDKEGNKITMDNLEDALMTVEEQEAEGIPTHRNYPFYIRGRVVAVLEDTVPFWSVMPEVQDIINKKVAEQIGERDVYEVDMDGVTTTVKVKDEANNTRTVETYNSADKKIDSLDRTISIDDDAREFIEANYGAIISEKKGGTVSPATARSDAYRSAMMSATSVAEVNAPAVSDVAAFVARLSSAFPGVEVVTTQKEFDAMVKEQGTKGLTTQTQKVYGAVVDGTVFLNPKLENYNTPVHEFGHLWMNTAKELNPEAYRRGIELVADSDYVRQVKESADYIRILKRMKRDGSTEQEINDYVLEEALALAIGNKGESFVKAAQQRSFKTWLNDLFNFVKGLVGISNISSADLQNLTLDEFSSAVVVDLMSENEIFAQAEVARLSDSVQFMIGPNQDASLTQVVEMGRERGYSDAAIKKLLLNRGAHTAEQINDALFEAYTKSVQVPAEFGNAVGGMNVGRKIFTDVRKGLNKYIKNYTPPIKKTKDGKEVKPEKTKDGKEIKPTPTRSQLRAEAMRLLTENIAFEKQPLAVREKLISAFDRSLGITASKDISQQVRAIRNNIRQRAKGAATLQQAKKALTTFIKETLPKSGTYSNSQINKLNSRVARATEASLLADMEYVLKQVEIQNNKIKKQVLKDLYTLARRDTKARLSIKGNKDKAADVGADAREFAGVFAQTLAAAMQTNQTAVMEISQILDGPEAVDALSKYIKGIETLQSEQESLSQLTTPEKKLVFQALAYQRLRDVSTMSLDEVNQLYMDFAIGSLNERIILDTKRHDRKLKNAERNDRLNAEIRENHPDLFTADGKPLNVNDRNRLSDSIKEAWNDRESGLSGNLKGLVAASKAFYENFNFTESAEMLKSILQNLKHLGTFMNVVGKGFKEEVYGRLNRAEERSLRGYFEQTENVMNGIAFNAGFESYVDMARQLYEAPPIKLQGIKRGDSTLLNKDLFSKNQLMRIYALSLNDVQRAKLAEQGLDFDNPQRAAEIEGILGPELMQVARETVEYLSSDYYESVNKVKRNVDDINMRYIPNYFPTQTVVTGQEANISHEDFGAQFSADNLTAMMNRNNVVSDVKLKGADFTSTLDSHFKEMERYKAYAYDVRSLQSLFNTEDFQSALTSLGIKSLVLQSMNIAINPDSAAGKIKGEKLLSWATTAYVGIALSFKAVQIPKQAMSAINAFPTYVHNKDGKRRPTDIFFWMMDYAHVLANPKKYLKIADDTSATFKMRRKLGRKGEVAGLEGGSPTRAGLEQRSRITRAYRTVAGAGTYIGDIAGVMGYMANHRRNLINGMDADTARDKFNDYNDSQQSRRGTERSIIQQDANPLIKLVTQFGSSSMLYINNTMQAGTNIIRDIKKGKRPSAEDIRKFYINLGTSNVLFIAMSNLPILLMGTSDEREEVYKKLLFAQLGLNLLNFIPSLASAASMVEGWATGKPSRQRGGLGIDPFTYIQRRMGTSESTEDRLIKVMQLALDLVLKTNTDTFIAGGKVLGDVATGDLNDADAFLESLGFSKSYRPAGSESKGTPQVKTRSEKRATARERSRNNR